MDERSVALVEMLRGVDEHLEGSVDRLKSVKRRLEDVLWDYDAPEIRNCLVDLNIIIRHQTTAHQQVRDWLGLCETEHDTAD